ncbi:unnamed protein product [marine sediment metagenome]|uniref:Type II secretion system protein GspG C-terminal domain-containing protein n=1 Tax=marine sediment metagenome TaxID=412755 RepID=X1KSL7_9ZZZZ
MKKAFTLVEILIVVAILGILAALTLPIFKDYITEAKEAAAKDNLRIFRNAIEIYAAQHNGVPPGYPNGDTSAELLGMICVYQLFKATNINGQFADVGTPGFPLGPYIPKIPSNPFNNIKTVKVLVNNEEFPTDATGDSGWIYKPATKQIRLDWPGADTKGIRYYDY